MKRKAVIGLTIGVLALLLGVWGVWKHFQNVEVVTPATNTSSSTNTTPAISIEDYIKANIARLSGEAGKPEVLGGKFYVTEFEASGGKGTVSYEDGHNAYTADFTYETSETGITPKSFKVQQ